MESLIIPYSEFSHSLGQERALMVAISKSRYAAQSSRYAKHEIIGILSPEFREGATGKTHDWAIDRALVAASPLPVILAGGLNADNVREAILATGADGVDVHTGIEGTDGRKDRAKTKRFVSEALAGLAVIGI